MICKQVRLAAFFLFAALAIQHVASASLVTVLNPSFELPDQANGDSTSAITSWVHTAGSSGVFDPNGQITPTHLNQVAYVNAGAVISQVLTATLDANTLYTLLVDVGDRIDTTFGGYVINLYAGTTLLASDPGLLTPDGGFLTSTIVYSSLLADPLDIGEALRIELRDGSASGTQTNFDNVRLDATVIPELSSAAIWSVLALTVGAGAKRRWRKAALK